MREGEIVWRVIWRIRKYKKKAKEAAGHREARGGGAEFGGRFHQKCGGEEIFAEWKARRRGGGERGANATAKWSPPVKTKKQKKQSSLEALPATQDTSMSRKTVLSEEDQLGW